jgi:glycosyltransferase involved in cell wall biosynthesis
VLPCFDEAANVAAAIKGATWEAQRISLAYEVVVVDDGSSDETAAIAGWWAARDPHVRIVRHARNRGYGAAVRSGIDAARMPWIFLTDADLQFDLAELDAFVPLATEAELVIGWRLARHDPLVRKANAAAWNWLVARALDLHVRDVDCAFKLMRTDAVAPLRLTSEGATISAELLVKAFANGARVRQLGVHHRPRLAGRQSGARLPVIARALCELIALRRARQTVIG